MLKPDNKRGKSFEEDVHHLIEKVIKRAHGENEEDSEDDKSAEGKRDFKNYQNKLLSSKY